VTGKTTLDPQRISWMNDVRTADCLYEGLLRIHLPGSTVEPAVALNVPTTEPDLSADKRHPYESFGRRPPGASE